MSEKPVWAPVLLHHSAMPNWKKIEGLEIKAVPECEGGGFMVRTWQAERIVEAFNLAHRWAPVIEAVGEWRKALESYSGYVDAYYDDEDLWLAEAALSTAYDAVQPPDPDTEQVDGEMPQYTGLCECSPDTSHEKGVCMVCGFPRMHLHTTEQHGLPTDVNEDAPDPYWWCDKCGREVGSGAVRFDETHDLCGMPVRGIQPPDEP